MLVSILIAIAIKPVNTIKANMCDDISVVFFWVPKEYCQICVVRNSLFYTRNKPGLFQKFTYSLRGGNQKVDSSLTVISKNFNFLSQAVIGTESHR